MKFKTLIFLVVVYFLSSCASVPKETVALSKLLGNDLKVLHNSHKTLVELYYKEIIDNVNVFVDDVYAPFVIHFVLKAELEKYNSKEESIYGTIEKAGKVGGKTATEDALNIMTEFLKDANDQVEKKRKELLDPIINQKNSVLTKVDNSYQNATYANTAITGNLESIQKVKKSQQEALSLMSLQGKDDELNSILLRASELTKSAIIKGKDIDVKSDDAYAEIKKISDEIKSITNKN